MPDKMSMMPAETATEAPTGNHESPSLATGTPDLVRRFLHNADTRGDQLCLCFLDEETATATDVSFAGLALEASAFARELEDKGLQAGDLVLIFLDHHKAMYASFMGAMMAGCVPSFMPCPSPNQDPVRYWSAHRALLQRIDPKAIVTMAVQARAMADNGLVDGGIEVIDVDAVVATPRRYEPPAFDPDQVAFLQHSSGTTGLKKGVALSHGAVVRQIDAYAATLGLEPEDTIVSWLPVYHDMGLIACMIMPLITGNTTVLMAPLKWAMRPVMLFEAIQAYQGRFVWMPNFAFEHLAKTAGDLSPSADLSRVKAFISCSEPCKLNTVERFVETFVGWGVSRTQMQMCYAMAENVFAATQTRIGSLPRGDKPDAADAIDDDGASRPEGLSTQAEVASVGYALPGVEICIRDGHGRPLSDGIVGEITLSGDCLFEGYFKLPEVTAERLADGWYKTRDMGFIRNQELFVLGRLDDLIIVNGKNYYAHDLEAIVSDIEGLKPGRNVAFGVFNPELGSEEIVIIAQALAQTDAPLSKLKRAIKKTIFDDCGLIIKESRIVEPDWLVKTSSGKISREANRAKYIAEVTPS